jgi:hypothetical protein
MDWSSAACTGNTSVAATIMHNTIVIAISAFFV